MEPLESHTFNKLSLANSPAQPVLGATALNKSGISFVVVITTVRSVVLALYLPNTGQDCIGSPTTPPQGVTFRLNISLHWQPKTLWTLFPKNLGW